MQTVKTGLPLIVLILLILALPVLSQVAEDKLVVPGQRLGKLALDVTIDDLSSANGSPTIREIRWPRPELEVATFRPTTLFFWSEFVAGSRDGKKVDLLYSAPNSNVATEKRIRYNSKSDEIMDAYGSPTYAPPLVPGLFQRLLVYDRIGLFFILTFDSVRAIGVFRPGMARDLWVVQ